MAKRKADTHLMMTRYMQIHHDIRELRYPNVPRLAEKLEVSKATIYRDIEYMKGEPFCAPIVFSRERNGYYYEQPDYVLPGFDNLDDEDIAALFDSRALLQYYRDTPVYERMERVLERLSRQFVDGPSVPQARLAIAPRQRSVINKETWAAVCDAMRRNRVLEFDYRGRWHTELTHRSVRPYQLLLDEGVCYLFGYAEERGATRLFVLSRMERIRVTERTFELPADSDFSAFCRNGKFGAFVGDKKIFRYKIAFYGSSRVWVKECIWADDQQLTETRDATVISFTSSQRQKVLEWVLSRGEEARPLQSRSLVQAWKYHIEGMARRARR